MSWDQRFCDPIILPSRKPLVTLRDAAQYIIKLPKAARTLVLGRATRVNAGRTSLHYKVLKSQSPNFLIAVASLKSIVENATAPT
jgi:hypothetical protein